MCVGGGGVYFESCSARRSCSSRVAYCCAYLIIFSPVLRTRDRTQFRVHAAATHIGTHIGKPAGNKRRPRENTCNGFRSIYSMRISYAIHTTHCETFCSKHSLMVPGLSRNARAPRDLCELMVKVFCAGPEWNSHSCAFWFYSVAAIVSFCCVRHRRCHCCLMGGYFRRRKLWR